MKKVLALILALVMVFALAACGSKPAASAPAPAAEPAAEPTAEPAEEAPDYSDYTIRIYSNSNSTERVEWLVAEAAKAGFSISLDTNEVYSGDDKAVQAAN